MSLSTLFLLAPLGSMMALVFAFYFYKDMVRKDPGTPEMQKIAGYVKKGALAYLKRQYKVVSIVFVVVFFIFAFMAYVLGTHDDHIVPWRSNWRCPLAA